MNLSATAGTHFMERITRHVERCLEMPDREEPRCRILFVDDERDVQVAFKALFKCKALSHCSVEFADSLNQAMAMIATRTYDLLILDYAFPEGLASQLVHDFRSYGYDIPFLCISGHDEAEVPMKELGASGFLTKIDASIPANLSRAINNSLDRYWCRQRL